MIIDKQLVLANDQALSALAFVGQAVTGNLDSTNVLDQVKGGDADEPLYLQLQVSDDATSAGAATLQPSLQTSANGTNYTVLWQGPVFALAALKAGTILARLELPLGVQEYLKVVWTVAGAVFAGGAVDARLVPQLDTAADVYAAGV